MIVKTQTRAVLAVAFAFVLVMAMPFAAEAQPTQEGSGFGQHAAQCAQTMGFSADHNPGMHHGARGWDGKPCWEMAAPWPSVVWGGGRVEHADHDVPVSTSSA